MDLKQHAVSLDDNVSRVKKKRWYKFMDRSAPFRANVVHQFRKFSNTNNKRELLWFMKNVLTSMCESSGTNDVPTQRSFGVWIADYNDG